MSTMKKFVKKKWKVFKSKMTSIAASGSENLTPSRSKRLSWGPYVSPEYIDKTLPPSTPVRRGGTPKRDQKSVVNAVGTPSSLLKKSLLQKKQKEEDLKKSALKRRENDVPLVKENSGHRASPRTSPQASVKTPKAKSPKSAKTPKPHEVVERVRYE